MIVRWLYPQWVGAALCCGVLFTTLIPLMAANWDPALLMIFALLPVYMFHQVEEHYQDRFRRWVNEEMFGGAEALTPAAVLVINIPGVWGVGLVSLYAASFIGIGWGLTMVYLVLVNAVIHILSGLASRRYNPGLWTSIALFLPASIAALMVIDSHPEVGPVHHAAGLGIAILIHAAIIVYSKQRVARFFRFNGRAAGI